MKNNLQERNDRILFREVRFIISPLCKNSEERMDELVIYLIIAVLMFVIGLVAGYLVMSTYYSRRFLAIAKDCERVDSIVPLISEMERES